MSHFARAQLLIGHSRFEEAIGELQQHLAEDPNNPGVHAQMALCLLHLKRYAEAMEQARLAVHLGPDQSMSHYVLAEVLYGRNRPKEALPAATEALRLDPGDPDNFALLARIHFAQSRWQAAFDAATEGLACDPEHLACTNLRAMSLVKLGRRAEAGATIDTALARNPEVALTHANQGWTLLERRRPKEAMEHFREALRIDPELEWARHGIVEAMKARHGVYRWMLMWFFWMARLPPKFQWGVVVGGYFVMQALKRFAAANPEWSGWTTPVLIVYVIFALLTWIADPLFNLLLRLNRFGRLALSREQVVASNWLGLSLAAAIAMLAWALVSDRGEALFAAIVFGVLCLPISAIYRCHVGKPRGLMTLFTIALAVIGLLGFLPLLVAPEASQRFSVKCIELFLLGAIAAPWVGNVLMAVPTRH